MASQSHMQELYLRKNYISDISEIRYLAGLHDLRVLWLCDNPCADHPLYRQIVACMLPSVEKLDNQEITPQASWLWSRPRHVAASCLCARAAALDQAGVGIWLQVAGRRAFGQDQDHVNRERVDMARHGRDQATLAFSRVACMHACTHACSRILVCHHLKQARAGTAADEPLHSLNGLPTHPA